MGLGICPSRERNRTVFLGSQCSHSDFITGGMACGRANLEASCLLLHVLVACTLVELHKAFRRREPQRWACRVATVLSVGLFRLIQDLHTSLVVFLRGTCSDLGPPEGGIVYGLFSKEALQIGKASVSGTHSPMSGCTSHFRCLYRPGLKDANKPRYRLLRRKLMSVRFFSLAVFPTISQTLAAEALAISMEAPMGNARDAAEERRIRRKGENAKVRAPRRRPSSWRRQTRRPWESIWGCSVTHEALANRSQGKPLQFPGALGLDIPFSLLYTAQTREEHAYYDFQGPLYLFDPCRLGLFLAYCAKGSNRSNFPWIRLPRWPRWEIASYLYGACRHVSEFLKRPSRQCSASRVLDYLLRLRAGGFRRSWQFAKRAARGGCGSSMARGPFGTFNPRISRTGRLSNLPMRWRSAACGPRRDSGDHRCGSRLMMSILNVSHFLGRGQPKREFHKEFIHNFMEPCAVYWILFIKLGRRHRSGQSWKCRSRPPCAMVMSSLRTIVRPTRRGAWIGKNYSCTPRRNCCKTIIPGLSRRGFKNGCLHSSSHQIYTGTS